MGEIPHVFGEDYNYIEGRDINGKFAIFKGRWPRPISVKSPKSGNSYAIVPGESGRGCIFLPLPEMPNDKTPMVQCAIQAIEASGIVLKKLQEVELTELTQ
jgi:hypothetical protein